MGEKEHKHWHNSLYKGPNVSFGAYNLDQLGESLIKLRVVRGWTQEDLAVRLEMPEQQVQRYERNGWQKISMWRLQEVIEALGAFVDIRVALREEGG